MAHIDYYLSTISPYTYLAGTRLEEIASVQGATITYKPLDAMQLYSRTGGTAPKDRHENRKAYRLQELRRQSSLTGLPMNIQPAHWPTNGAPASYAIIAAQKAKSNGGAGGDLGVLCHAILRACWAEEKDIAGDGVIKDCLELAGFDPGLADTGLLAGAETYEANLEEAVARGAFGTPFYIVTGTDERFWGQDRLSDLETYLAGNL